MATVESQSAAGEPPSILSEAAFRNWRLGALWILAGLVSSAAAVVFYRRGFALFLMPFGLYCFYAAIIAAMGVVARNGQIAVPVPLFRLTPILPKKRAHLPIAALKDLTALGRAFGQEIVGLSIAENQIPVPFATRAMRLAFFAFMGKMGVRIYRAHS